MIVESEKAIGSEGYRERKGGRRVRKKAIWAPRNGAFIMRGGKGPIGLYVKVGRKTTREGKKKKMSWMIGQNHARIERRKENTGQEKASSSRAKKGKKSGPLPGLPRKAAHRLT